MAEDIREIQIRMIRRKSVGEGYTIRTHGTGKGGRPVMMTLGPDDLAPGMKNFLEGLIEGKVNRGEKQGWVVNYSMVGGKHKFVLVEPR